MTKNEDFSNLIKTELEQVGFDKLSERYNLNKDTIRLWARGKSKPVSVLEELIRFDIMKRRSMINTHNSA